LNGNCITPVKLCPSQNPGAECSGHGSCKYKVGNEEIPTEDCLVSNINCVVNCKCSDGYGGEDCSLDPHTLAQKADARVKMCTAQVNVLASSDPSSDLFGSLSSTIDATYSPAEIIREQGRASCFDTLNTIVNASKTGYLTTDAASALTNTISKFIKCNLFS
jgi:hypothetical protein